MRANKFLRTFWGKKIKLYGIKALPFFTFRKKKMKSQRKSVSLFHHHHHHRELIWLLKIFMINDDYNSSVSKKAGVKRYKHRRQRDTIFIQRLI